jgi:hypothetical protein
MNVLLVQKEVTWNGGYASPAMACKELIIEKNGVVLKLDGSELAQLYNAIRPVGTAPKMGDPNDPESI